MKGQMFIVTMVFLVSLIFVVQINLIQYTKIDTVNALSSHDTYILNNIREVFQGALDMSPDDCGAITYNVYGAVDYLNQQNFIGGYTVDLGDTKNNLFCDLITPDVHVDVEITLIKGTETETEVIYRVIRN